MNIFNKILLNAAKCEGYSFYLFWVIKGKRTPFQIRFKTLDILLISCEISLILTWPGKCVITSKATRDADPDANPAVAAGNSPINATLKITDTNLYVPVVTLSTEDENNPAIKSRI